MIRSSSAPFFPFLSFFSTSRSSGHKSGANSSKERKIDVAVKSVRESLSRNELRTIFISHDWLVSIRPSTGPGCFPLRSTLPRIRLAVVFHSRGERGGDNSPRATSNREFPFLPFSPRFLSPRLTALLSSDVRI